MKKSLRVHFITKLNFVGILNNVIKLPFWAVGTRLWVMMTGKMWALHSQPNMDTCCGRTDITKVNLSIVQRS